jgi:hypothetical protein
LPDLYYLGDFRGAAVYGFFAASKFFLVDAPGGPGLVAFVSTRLRQLGREPVAPSTVLLTSCGADETAGLPELVQKCHVSVVVAPTELQAVKAACPAGAVVLSAEELPDRGWFPVRTIPLQGRGLAPVAYQVSWAGKTVLFSGRIPTKVKPETWAALFPELSKSSETRLAYLASVERLGGLKPDLWLPAVPTDGQNANLYDNEWQDIIADNYSLRGPQ